MLKMILIFRRRSPELGPFRSLRKNHQINLVLNLPDNYSKLLMSILNPLGFRTPLNIQMKQPNFNKYLLLICPVTMGSTPLISAWNTTIQRIRICRVPQLPTMQSKCSPSKHNPLRCNACNRAPKKSIFLSETITIFSMMDCFSSSGC